SNNNVNLVGLSAGQPDFVKNPPKKRKISLKKAEKIKNPPQFVGHAQTLESIKKKIMKSTAEDWLFDDIQGIYTYKKDVNLTIRRTPYEESEEFHEKWLDVYADRKGHTSNHDIYYSSSFIERIFIVAVDGYRKYIPYPDINDLTLTKYQYAVGRIINDAYGTLPGSGVFTSFDDYLQRAGIKVK
ncbi:MAG: hypothetical protein NT051_06570, partial [Candidatus Micrarchaeota archaeon]|nr:hypothetical protein [Candidatus Micrarchaeota archaeon]